MKTTRRKVLQSGALGLAAAALARADQPQQARRRAFRLTTREKFDAGAIAPYRGQHTAVYQNIDAHLEEHLEHLRRWLRQPSVSAQNIGIQEMARLLRDDLRALGFQEAELVPTAGHPGVWGYYDAGAPRTLVVYLMYDVQPVEPADWRVPPFDAQLVEHDLGRVVMARGATNQKGPQRAFLNAVAAIRAVHGRLPVNLMVVAEGEEELGSVHFPEVIARYESRLKNGYAVFFPFPSQGVEGQARLFLGVKGILYFELEAVGGAHGGPTRAEIHGSYKAVVDSPVWRLVQALASLTSPDGNTILVPGYYDPIRPPNDEEQRLVNGLLSGGDEAGQKRLLGVERWMDGVGGEQFQMRLLFDTTLNIDGLVAGYTGPGGKTILPHRALAKVDSRLVPDQRPDEALERIRQHLHRQGFHDITVRKLSGYPPAQTSVQAPPVRAAISVFNKYGHRPTIAPRIAGSAPYYLFTERLNLPMVAAGLGHGSGAHAPNEYLLVDPKPGSKIAGLAEMEKAYVDLLYALAEA